ncbi:PREDICTED: cytochrome b5 domain-containing protein 1 [Nicrophorus vespilloides]|uniref:Cytochrome b5 domain-containing protein 1 n=1 Tax=Nicrophorus vespilloides TaxID=110193 RepID=A0ABM1MLB5_NICVS|nr:PREDICTED: cytochrome b5 domain-containing protein 1 [Nicrophorus vespilloides]
MGEEINYSGLPQKYFGPFEVVIHNRPEDCWVSLLGKVLNITPLIKEHESEDCVKPLLAFAGKDISDWFDPRDGDILHYVHPVSGCHDPYIPHGRIPDVEVQVPATRWQPLDRKPWWKDPKYEVGLLTKKVRPIRIINPLFGLEVHMNVCCEDTVLRIKERYSIFNSDANIYLWRYMDNVLNDELTLEENGIIDETDRFGSVGLSPTFYVPAIMIFYNDEFRWFKNEDCIEMLKN